MASTTLTIRMDEHSKERLQALAKCTGRSSSFLAAEALEQYLDLQAWQIAGIQKAIDSVETKGTVPHDEVVAWIESWGTENELPRPKPRRR